jgi:pimeloyl-ACP methyl ester carboxylesterase
MRAMRGLATATALASVACMPPEWGANGLLHPMRRPLVGAVDLPHEDVAFRSDGLLLKGWLFRGRGVRRGLIVHLHGVADNRRSGVGIAQRFVPKGYDVLTYDSRAHGESEGKDCTYGFYEKRDLSAALDAIHAEEAILFGSSLGAAVALQAAADDPRIRGVIAQSAFSDLETIARERAPFVATSAEITEAFAIAERNGHFRIAEVSPRLAASRIRVPVLLIHGEKDRETSATHSRRIYDALGGPRRLLLVPGRGHNDALRDEGTWKEIEAWLDALPVLSTVARRSPELEALAHGGAEHVIRRQRRIPVHRDVARAIPCRNAGQPDFQRGIADEASRLQQLGVVLAGGPDHGRDSRIVLPAIDDQRHSHLTFDLNDADERLARVRFAP